MNELNNHIQSAHTDDITSICESTQCKLSQNKMNAEINSLKVSMKENEKVVQEALDANNDNSDQ